jgi:antitoxin ParD1/3/4
MTKLGIAIADDDIGWAEARIAAGEYANMDAYVSQLIRRDRVECEETAWLQAEIDKGRASGVINRDASEVLREVMALSSLLAIGNNDIAAGKTAPVRDVIVRLKAKATATEI